MKYPDLFTELRYKSHEILDLLIQNKISVAEIKISELTKLLNELILISKDKGTLKVLNHYKILMRQMKLKIATLKNSIN